MRIRVRHLLTTSLNRVNESALCLLPPSSFRAAKAYFISAITGSGTLFLIGLIEWR